MEVIVMDGADLRLLFILGLVVLTIVVGLLARAVDVLVTGGRTSKQAAATPITGNAPVPASRTSLPDRGLLLKQARWRLLL
jgi:hypothetical protein